jgi:hypothetical protein
MKLYEHCDVEVAADLHHTLSTSIGVPTRVVVWCTCIPLLSGLLRIPDPDYDDFQHK